MTLDADIIIAGASTAGLSTAILARQAGFSCIVIEPRDLKTEKACGEGLMPPAVTLLREMGIKTHDLHPISGVRYVTGDSDISCKFPSGQGLGVRRSVLSERMLNRANALEVKFIQGRVDTFAIDQDTIEANGLRARWIVGCDGLRSRVRNAAGGSNARIFPPRFGLRQHFRVEQAPDFVEVYWTSYCEIYVTPVARDLVNVAVLFKEGRPFEEFLAAVPQLKKKLGEPVTAVRGAGPFEQRPFHPHSKHVFLVGDAAGFLDPITGEGNQLAMASAQALVDCFKTGAITQYPHRWHQVTRNYWWITSGLLWLATNDTRRRLIEPLLKHCPSLFRFGLARLAGSSATATWQSPSSRNGQIVNKPIDALR